jgi:hypothetical protein
MCSPRRIVGKFAGGHAGLVALSALRGLVTVGQTFVFYCQWRDEGRRVRHHRGTRAQLAADLADEINGNRRRFDKLVKDMTARATPRKSVKTVRTPPALIDPPGAFAPLEEWIEFRDQLRQSGIPRIASILRETDRHIARLRRQATR